MPTKYINSTAESDEIHEQLFTEKKTIQKHNLFDHLFYKHLKRIILPTYILSEIL